MSVRLLAVSAALLSLVLVAPGVRAEHAKITLEVSSGGRSQTAFVDQTPPESGKNPRAVLKAKAGAPIKIQWTFTNVYPHKTIEDALLHSFVAREKSVGQKDLPPLDDDVILQTAFRMDFKPGGKGGAKSTLTIREPGVYLVRVESRDTGSDHEHFAAIDLVVEPADPEK